MHEKSPAQILADIELPRRGAGRDGDAADASEPMVLEDYVPLWDGIERRLADAMWQVSGAKSFLRGDVPYVVNNSGWAAAAAARVLLASCDTGNGKDEPVTVLELGAGLGMFAKQFLDAFKRICEEAGRDHYRRLAYHVTDGSPRTVEGWAKSNLFADHRDRVVIATADAGRPLELTSPEGRSISLSDLDGVVANYVLDSLPSAVLRRHEGRSQQLHVRTLLNPERIPHGARSGLPSLDDVSRWATSSDVHDLERLLPVLPWMEFESRFLDGGLSDLPYVDDALELAGQGPRGLLNHCAIDCLTACIAALRPAGFMLVRDYGPVHPSRVSSVAYPGRFGDSIAMPVNFAMLDRFFEARGIRIERPDHDDEPTVHSRLLSASDAVQAEFMEAFSDRRFVDAEKRAGRATEHINAHRFAEAIEIFREGLEYCPDDWHLLGHAAQFVNQQLLRHEDGLQLARRALSINPNLSAFLWNTLGNCLFSLERFDEASEAYGHALAIDDRDAQTRLNQAYVWDARGERNKALDSIARGLKCDFDGRFRIALLEKQRGLLDGLDAEVTASAANLERRGSVLARDD